MALDEATALLLKQMAEARPTPLHEMTPRQAREFLDSMRPQYGDGPVMASVEDHPVPVSGGTITARVLDPTGSPEGVIVYYHGGGWVIGSIDASDQLGRRLAAQTNCVVVLVDYRLAPEYRFPTAVDDAYAALRWTDRRLEQLAGRRVPIVVAGDSAGGNLAAVAALRARDTGEVPVGLQVLVYPVTDCDFATDSYLDPENALMLSTESMVWFWDHYAPEPAGRTHPDASPLRAPDLSNLPPAVVLTAEHDVLRSEGDAYARRLAESGVAVQHRCFTGQMHGFLTSLDVLPGSDEAIRFIVGAVGEHLASGERHQEVR